MAEEIKFDAIKNGELKLDITELVTGDFNDIIDVELLNILLELPDEQFAITAELILEELQKGLSNPQDRALLRKSFEQAGMSTEELLLLYNTFTQQIDDIENDAISQMKKDFLKRMFGMMVNEVTRAENEYSPVIDIPIELSNGAIAPTYAHEGDGAMDIYALEDYTINPGETVLVKTGIKVAIPLGFALLIQPRSGQSLKTKLRVANTPGLIDSGYRDEIGVIIENVEAPIKNIEYDFVGGGNTIVVKSIEHGKPYIIEKGQRIAQMRLVSVPTVNWTEVYNIGEVEGDRNGGFGSTGI